MNRQSYPGRRCIAIRDEGQPVQSVWCAREARLVGSCDGLSIGHDMTARSFSPLTVVTVSWTSPGFARRDMAEWAHAAVGNGKDSRACDTGRRSQRCCQR